MLRLALRNIFRQRLRTLLTVMAIATGVIALILSGGFVHDMFDQLAETTIHSQLGHVQIYKAGYYKQGAKEPDKYFINDLDRLKGIINNMPRIEDVMARLNFSALINNGRADYPIIGEGLEPDKEAKLGTFITILQGRQLNDKDRFGIVVGEGVANAQKLKPGERVTLLLNTSQGALNSLDFEVVGVFRSFSKDYDDRAVRINLTAAQELLDTKGANAIVVALKNRSDTDAAKIWLENRLLPDQFETKAWYELADFYKKTTDLYQREFGILQLIILITVLLSVVNSVGMSTFERIGEFGTMRAMGDRSQDIFHLVVIENVSLGIIGAAIGVVLGVLLALIISAVGIPMPPPPNMNSGYTATILLTPFGALSAFAVGVIGTALACLLPARRVSRIPLIEALRENT
ncbi:MAG: ABC transporter permease [Pseudomonadota bacterium]